MFRNPVDATNPSSGSDTNTGVSTRVKVPRVAGKHKRNIMANLKRAHSNPNLSPSDELSPMSQAAIMKGLSQGRDSFSFDQVPELKTPPSDSSDNSDAEGELLLQRGEALFTELDVLHLDPLLQKDGSRRVSSDLLSATSSPSSSPLSLAAVTPLIEMPTLAITSSPTLAPTSVVSVASPKPREELEEIKDSITVSLKDIITDELKEKTKSGGHTVSEVTDDNGATRRAVSHIVEETIEVVAFTPKKLKPGSSNDDAHGENKESEPNVFLHYKNPLFDTMMAAAQLSGQYDYDPKRMFHKHEPTFPSKKKAKQLPKSIDGTKPSRDQAENLQQLLNGAKVIVPICIGFDGALTGHSLEEVLKFYAGNKAETITVYMGEYNRLEDPEDRLAEIGKTKRDAWQENNREILNRYANGYTLQLESSLPDNLSKIHNPIIVRNGSPGLYTYQLIVNPAVSKDAIDVTDEKLVAELNSKPFSAPGSTSFIASASPLAQCITSAGGQPRPLLKMLLREDLVKTDEYKEAKKFITDKFHNRELKFSSVSKDAYGYMTGKQKPSTPQLSGMQGDNEGIVSQLMLSSDGDEADDQDIKQFKAVAQATVEAAIKDSADKVKDGARFLFEFRAIQEANNRSMFKQNTMFAPSAAAKAKPKAKEHNVSHGVQQQGNGGPRMTLSSVE